ncbi:2'-5' RNA ligase family protein [Kocuria sp.]|uniref:2'-5' RNA ligase family protein n=1 Tax=Kocuria sp. TaxID=1871328 RepID=UPI0026DB453F|nr:2'-5' RNA ligase family protein [Kocuria sp.]MDO4919331.1 2'-5' RNA ligase family protein [Kocuria sp.]
MSENCASPTLRPGRTYAGVVIPLPEPTAQELRDWRESFGDPRARTVPAHITLMISPVERNWEQLSAHVRDVAARCEPFHVQLSGTGTFRPVTPVVYLRVGRGHQQCVTLHQMLHARSVESASPFDYHPHVTLAHGGSQETLDRAQETLRTYRAGFLVDGVHLYECAHDGSWDLREHIPLGLPAGGHGPH